MDQFLKIWSKLKVTTFIEKECDLKCNFTQKIAVNITINSIIITDTGLHTDRFTMAGLFFFEKSEAFLHCIRSAICMITSANKSNVLVENGKKIPTF